MIVFDSTHSPHTNRISRMIGRRWQVANQEHLIKLISSTRFSSIWVPRVADVVKA